MWGAEQQKRGSAPAPSPESATGLSVSDSRVSASRGQFSSMIPPASISPNRGGRESPRERLEVHFMAIRRLAGRGETRRPGT